MSKERPLLKAIFSTANWNGVGATLMSANVGSRVGTAMYVCAVAAGTYNKYRGLTNPGEKKGPVLNFLTHPSITATTFVGAAIYNLFNATQTYLHSPPAAASANLAIVIGWIAALFGDNALRRLDSVNFKKNAQELGGEIKSKLRKTFNALVSNPTIFYGITSTCFVGSELINRKDADGNALSIFADLKGWMGMGTASLVGLGIAYAGYRTWKAVQGKITNEQINNGAMNWMAFIAKLSYGVIAWSNKEYGLSIAHLLFAGSSLKVIKETRTALDKKSEQGALPAPAPL